MNESKQIKHRLSKKAHNVLNSQEIQAKFPYLIKVEHFVKGEVFVYRYVNADDPIVFEGEQYEPAIFKITPPEVTETKIGNATLTMTNIDQVWIDKIRNTDTRAKIRFVAAMMWNEDGDFYVEKLFNNDFVLTNATWDELSITWTMVFDDKWDIRIPCHICDTITTPGVA